MKYYVTKTVRLFNGKSDIPKVVSGPFDTEHSALIEKARLDEIEQKATDGANVPFHWLVTARGAL